MLPLKTHVKNGRVVLDEPVDLPDGTPVVLLVEEQDSLDDMTPEDRAELDLVLDAGFQAVAEGRVTEGDEIVRRLLARP